MERSNSSEHWEHSSSWGDGERSGHKEHSGRRAKAGPGEHPYERGAAESSEDEFAGVEKGTLRAEDQAMTPGQSGRLEKNSVVGADSFQQAGERSH